jgi:hypothetical protein
MFTYEPEALKRLIEATPSGMAYWSGTGPPRTVCEQCSFFGYSTQYPYSCYRYFEVFRDHGPPLPVGLRHVSILRRDGRVEMKYCDSESRRSLLPFAPFG